VQVHYGLEKLLPQIVTQLGSTNRRTAQGCEQTIQFLSWKPNVGCAYIARHVLGHDHGKNVRALEAKLHMLAQVRGYNSPPKQKRSAHRNVGQSIGTVRVRLKTVGNYQPCMAEIYLIC